MKKTITERQLHNIIKNVIKETRQSLVRGCKYADYQEKKGNKNYTDNFYNSLSNHNSTLSNIIDGAMALYYAVDTPALKENPRLSKVSSYLANTSLKILNLVKSDNFMDAIENWYMNRNMNAKPDEYDDEYENEYGDDIDNDDEYLKPFDY